MSALIVKIALATITSGCYNAKDEINMTIQETSHHNILSVIIPTYNQYSLLERSLSSLFKQNYALSKYEIIVVDDNSNDNTEQMLKKYLKKYSNLLVIKNKINRGSGYARTLGINQAKGNVLVFTDSDCILPEDWLKKIAERFENKDVVCVQGTQECRGKWGKFMYEGRDAIDFFKSRNILDTKNLAIRRDLILKYKFDSQMRYSSDYELGQRLSRDVKIHYDSNITVIHTCDNFHSSIERGKHWGQAQGLTYIKHGKGVNPKFKYPLFMLLFYYLGGLLYFSVKYKSIRGGIAFFTTTLFTAIYYKKTINQWKSKKSF